MKKLYSVALALLCSVQVFAQSQQAGADEICAVAGKHYETIRTGDTGAIVNQHLPEFTFFTPDGGLLWSFASLDQQRSEFELDPTWDSQTYIRHCSAQIYGDTAVATYYLTGSVTNAGKTRTGTWRVTEVWVRQQNEWKEAHHHESPLLTSLNP